MACWTCFQRQRGSRRKNYTGRQTLNDEDSEIASHHESPKVNVQPPVTIPSQEKPPPPIVTQSQQPPATNTTYPYPNPYMKSADPFVQLQPSDITYKVRSGPKMIRQYSMGGTLGEGAYATVKEGFDTITHTRVAIKILKRRRLKKPGVEAAAFREISLLQKLGGHPHIVRLLDFFTLPEKNNNLYMVLEYVGGGNTLELLERAPSHRLPLPQAQALFRQLIEAVGYIHSLKITHRDIKPDNLIITSGGCLKLTDFGSAEEVGDYNVEYDASNAKISGSPAFTPPELASGNIPLYSPYKADLWAMGVTLYNLVLGQLPFNGSNVYSLFENITRGEYLLPDTLDPTLADLLRGILHPNYRQRLTLAQIKAHPWVVMNIVSEIPPIPPTTSNIGGQLTPSASSTSFQTDESTDDYDDDTDTIQLHQYTEDNDEFSMEYSYAGGSTTSIGSGLRTSGINRNNSNMSFTSTCSTSSIGGSPISTNALVENVKSDATESNNNSNNTQSSHPPLHINHPITHRDIHSHSHSRLTLKNKLSQTRQHLRDIHAHTRSKFSKEVGYIFPNSSQKSHSSLPLTSNQTPPQSRNLNINVINNINISINTPTSTPPPISQNNNHPSNTNNTNNTNSTNAQPINTNINTEAQNSSTLKPQNSPPQTIIDSDTKPLQQQTPTKKPKLGTCQIM
eukprot:TRINITY_DN6218_c0_g1_i2.p1 TRINITY_DN6218_c0_g1~~TRINITY_DN6218_c0_g1_i2.p1  ORF type:complete len:679 (-),score=133.90 TRINITY_DN6218_c0_g1_i2:394-2430(-)